MLRSDSAAAEGNEYFPNFFNFVHLLCNVALGNASLEDAKEEGRFFDRALNSSKLFEQKSTPMVYAVLLATDALGALESVRYFGNPGSPNDAHNRDAQMMLAQSGDVLSRFGMVAETLHDPAHLDFEAIIKAREGAEPYLTPEFFARRLWPDDEIFTLGRKGMRPGFEIILDDWIGRLRELRLFGVVASYESCLNGMYLRQARLRAGSAATHYHTYLGEVHMGDVFQGISNSTIVSRSKVEGAFNRLQNSGQGESAKLLVEIGKHVSDSNNAAAGVVYSQMTEELSKPSNDKGVLKSYWDGLVAIIPPLAKLSAEVIKAFAI
jgi:hypothetical protein